MCLRHIALGYHLLVPCTLYWQVEGAFLTCLLRTFRLNILGYRVGTRLLELLPLRDYLYPYSTLRSPPPPTRILRLLPILSYIHSTLYRYLFGRTADSLEKSTENEDEYMIGDDEMIVTRDVEVPREMKELSCGAIVAGIVEAVMDGAGFVSL